MEVLALWIRIIKAWVHFVLYFVFEIYSSLNPNFGHMRVRLKSAVFGCVNKTKGVK